MNCARCGGRLKVTHTYPVGNLTFKRVQCLQCQTLYTVRLEMFQGASAYLLAKDEAERLLPRPRQQETAEPLAKEELSRCLGRVDDGAGEGELEAVNGRGAGVGDPERAAVGAADLDVPEQSPGGPVESLEGDAEVGLLPGGDRHAGRKKKP